MTITTRMARARLALADDPELDLVVAWGDAINVIPSDAPFFTTAAATAVLRARWKGEREAIARIAALTGDAKDEHDRVVLAAHADVEAAMERRLQAIG